MACAIRDDCCCDDITKEDRPRSPFSSTFPPQFSIKFTMRRTGKAAVKNQCCRASSFILPILFWQFFKQKCRLMNLNNKTRLASIFLPLSLTTGHQFDFYKVITRLFSPPKENPTEHISVQLLPSSRACLHLSLEFFQQHLVNEESAGFAINDFAWNPQELKTPWTASQKGPLKRVLLLQNSQLYTRAFYQFQEVNTPTKTRGSLISGWVLSLLWCHLA